MLPCNEFRLNVTFVKYKFIICMKKSIFFLFLALAFIQACSQKKQDIKVNTDTHRKESSFKSMDFKKYFDSSRVKGSIVVYDLNADK